MSLFKKIRGVVAIACFATVVMTAAAPKAFAFDGLGGGSSNGEHWIKL